MWAWTMNASRKKAIGNGETFGQRLARLRKAAGYSQYEFAPEIGISRRMLCYYEAQSQHPPSHLFPAIAKALGITTDQLLGIERIPTRQPPLNRRLLRNLRKLESLAPHDQRAILRHIEALSRGASGGS